MEPRREEQQKLPPPGAERKRRHFRIVKLEERIAPTKGGNTKNCYHSFTCGGTCACSSRY
jgi:hypothetical protein